MNHIYRLIWNEFTRAWVAVADIVTGRGKGLDIHRSNAHAGECVFSQSRNASSMRVCQPRPVARKAASTSGLYRTATCTLVGRRFGPRVLARPTSTPSCFSVAPSQSETFVDGLSASWRISPSCMARTRGQSVRLAGVIFPVDVFFIVGNHKQTVDTLLLAVKQAVKRGTL